MTNCSDIENDWKIFYVGAGTSARIAVQDGSELFPTLAGQNLK